MVPTSSDFERTTVQRKGRQWLCVEYCSKSASNSKSGHISIPRPTKVLLLCWIGIQSLLVTNNGLTLRYWIIASHLKKTKTWRDVNVWLTVFWALLETCAKADSAWLERCLWLFVWVEFSELISETVFQIQQWLSEKNPSDEKLI